MRLTWGNVTEPTFQVFVVCFATMCLRQLAWAQAEAPPRHSPPSRPPIRPRPSASGCRPTAGGRPVRGGGRGPLPARPTDAGDELITARFGDALAELAAAPGFQTHRSWWVAADAIDEVTWLRGRGEARLQVRPHRPHQPQQRRRR